MNFLDGATSLDYFLNAYKSSETKSFSRYTRLDHPEKLQKTKFPTYGYFYSKLRCSNPSEAVFNDFVDLLINGVTTEQAVRKFNLSKPPPTGFDIYQFLQ